MHHRGYQAWTRSQAIVFIDKNGKTRYQIKSPPVENLVFEGGGVCGLAYAGVIAALAEARVLEKSHRIAGSSAGAITALAIALGFDAIEIQQIISSVDFNKLVDTNLRAGIKDLPAMLYLINTRGYINSGEALLEFIRGIVKRRLEPLVIKHADKLKDLQLDLNRITFKNLKDIAERLPQAGIKELYVTATELSQATPGGRLVVFSAQDKESENMEIALAVRTSASIPKFFKEMTFPDRPGKRYVDGGCLSNFPMEIFEDPKLSPKSPGVVEYKGLHGQNLCTLGFKIDTEEEMKKLLWTPNEKQTWGQIISNGIAGRLLDILTEVPATSAEMKAQKEVYDKYSQRTCQVFNRKVGIVEFDISSEKQRALFESGFETTRDWLRNYYGHPLAIDQTYNSFIEMCMGLPLHNLEALQKVILANEKIFFQEGALHAEFSAEDYRSLVETLEGILAARKSESLQESLEEEAFQERGFRSSLFIPSKKEHHPVLDLFVIAITPALVDATPNFLIIKAVLSNFLLNYGGEISKEKEFWTAPKLNELLVGVLAKAEVDKNWMGEMTLGGDQFQTMIEMIEEARSHNFTPVNQKP